MYKKTYFLNGPEYGREMMFDDKWYINIPVYEDLGLFNHAGQDRPSPKVAKYRRVFCGSDYQIMLDPASAVNDVQVIHTLRKIEQAEDKIRLMALGLWQLIVDAQRCS